MSTLVKKISGYDEDEEKNVNKVQTTYTAPPPVEDNSESNLDEEDVRARAGAKRARAAVDENPHDHTKDTKGNGSVLLGGEEKGFYGDIDTKSDGKTGDALTEKTDDKATPKTTTSQFGSYEDVYNFLYGSPEEREDERKRQKRAAIFSAISDGAAAISNLWATTQGAKNAYDGKDTMSKKTYDRWKERRKEDAEMRAKALSTYLTAKRLNETERYHDMRDEYLREDLERKKTERQQEINYKNKRLEIDEKYKQGILDWKKEQLELDRMYKEGQLSVSQYNAETNRLKALSEKKVEKTKYDPVTGEEITEETVTSYNTSNSNAGNSNAGTSKSSEDNTPPSKRPKGNNDSTPPSRRK